MAGDGQLWSGEARASATLASSRTVPLDDWQHEMERYLAHFARSGKRPTVLFTHAPHSTPGWTPAVDVYETASALVVRLDLAGVDPERTEVHAEPYLLTIRGVRRERNAAEGQQERAYHTLEIPYGRFERGIRLPAGLDTDAAQANYRDGLLEITLPKRAPREVPISVDSPSSAEA
jgi:HSP20 family protein